MGDHSPPREDQVPDVLWLRYELLRLAGQSRGRPLGRPEAPAIHCQCRGPVRRYGDMELAQTHGPGPTGQEAFEAFFARTRDRVLQSTLAAFGGEYDTEDAVAEAYARALARWADVSAHAAPEAWVMRTAVNLLRDRHRGRLRALRSFPRLVSDGVVEAPVAGIDPVVLAAIRRLPARQREVLALRVLLDLSAESTASALGISAQSVGTHLHRALAALRRTFASAGSSPTMQTDKE